MPGIDQIGDIRVNWVVGDSWPECVEKSFIGVQTIDEDGRAILDTEPISDKI